MTKRIAAVSIAALVSVVGFSATPAAAQQKAPVILVVNQQQVLGQSKAGQSIAAQLQKLQDDATTELNAQVQALQKEQDDLQKQKDLVAAEVWTEKAKALVAKQNNFPALRDTRAKELQISEQQALEKLNDSLTPILKKIVDTRGATILVDRAAVIFAAPETDVTAQVIADLDKAVTTVPVQKVSLADLQKQAAAAQSAAAKAAPAKKK